jgi:hypothetical protein
LDNSFQITEDCQWVLGKRFNEYKKWEIVKENFQTGENVIFSEVHKDFIYTLILHEKLNTVMSGSIDGFAVLYNWNDGKIKSKIKMDIGLVKSSLLMNSIVVLGGYFTIGFLDLKSGKKTQISQKNKIETECDHVFSIVYTEERSMFGVEGALVIGGSNSPIITRVKLIKEFVAKYSKKQPKTVPGKTRIVPQPKPIENQNTNMAPNLFEHININPSLIKPTKPKKDPIKLAFDSRSSHIVLIYRFEYFTQKKRFSDIIKRTRK